MKDDPPVAKIHALAFMLLAASLSLVSCAKPPIRLGFLGALTGKPSDLGVSGRDGAALAVAEINAKGGLLGRKVELVAEDDKQDPMEAVAAFDRLKAARVVAIVGPMTSDVALAVIPGANEARLPLISPTASTPRLTGIDDYFLRVNPPDRSESVDLARFAAEAGHKRIAVFCDLSNKSFSEGTLAQFEESLAALGGGKVLALPFNSSDSPSFSALVRQALGSRPDASLIVAGTADTAGIAQQLRKAGFRGTLYGTGWAMTDELVRNGGASVEGMSFSHYFDQNSRAKSWLDFMGSFETRFGRKPNFFAGLGYTAARVALDAISAGKSDRGLREEIIKIGRFQWLQGRMEIDRFGDAELERRRVVIRSGAFTAVDR